MVDACHRHRPAAQMVPAHVTWAKTAATTLLVAAVRSVIDATLQVDDAHLEAVAVVDQAAAEGTLQPAPPSRQQPRELAAAETHSTTTTSTSRGTTPAGTTITTSRSASPRSRPRASRPAH